MAEPSWIHEKAIDMIEAACSGAYAQPTKYTGMRGEVLVRLRPGTDEWSTDLIAGIEKVKITDPEWDSVGGIVPDIILYDVQGKPRRIIEVIVTSAPDNHKRQKLSRLQDRGVDVVEVTVKTEDDLFALFPPLQQPHFHARPGDDGRLFKNITLDDVTKALIYASPGSRRRFLHVLEKARELESIYPTAVR